MPPSKSSGPLRINAARILQPLWIPPDSPGTPSSLSPYTPGPLTTPEEPAEASPSDASLPKVWLCPAHPLGPGLPCSVARRVLSRVGVADAVARGAKLLYHLKYPPPPLACTALSKHGVGVEPPF